MKKKLNLKELAFCMYYARLQNHREAAVHAGYPAEQAECEGLRLLARSEVHKELEQLARRCVGRDLRARVKSGLERLAFGSICDAVQLLFLEDAPLPEVLADMDLFNVAEVKRGKNGVEVKLFDRFKAMEMLERLAEAEAGDESASPLYRAIWGSLGGTAPGAEEDVVGNDV